jgi:CBS domain-containing protein
MAEKNIGAVLVIESGRVAGIFSERDYSRRLVLKGMSSKETPVKKIMIDKVAYVRPSNTVEECMALMTDKRVRHLPVLDESRLVGLVSIGDVV